MTLDIQEAFNTAANRGVSRQRYEGELPDDLAAFIRLNGLVPSKYGIVACAEHDIIYLNTDVDILSEVATQEDINFLDSCGVFYESDNDCLAMFC